MKESEKESERGGRECEGEAGFDWDSSRAGQEIWVGEICALFWILSLSSLLFIESELLSFFLNSVNFLSLCCAGVFISSVFWKGVEKMILPRLCFTSLPRHFLKTDVDGSGLESEESAASLF